MTAPTEPTQPAGPVESTESTESTDPTNPTQPLAPVETAEVVEPRRLRIGPSTGRPSSAEWSALAVITVIGAIIRLTLAAQRSTAPLGDAYFYHFGANLLADGRGFIVPIDFIEDGIVTQAADHPPLFMTYLAGWSAVGLDSTRAHLVATALLGIAVIVLAGLYARRIAGPAVGLVAAGLVAVNPNLFGWDAMLLSEPMSNLTMLATLVAVEEFRRRPDLRWAIGTGLALGAAAMSRAELLALAPLVVIPVVLSRSALPWARRIALLCGAGAACVAVIAPWVGFNLSRFEEPVTLSTGFELTLAYSNCDSVYTGTIKGYWDIRCAPDAFEGRDDMAELDQSQRNAVWRDFTFDYIAEHRAEVPGVVWARIGRVLGVSYRDQQRTLDVVIEGREAGVTDAGMVAFPVLALASVAGWVVLGRRGIPRYPLAAPMAITLFAVVITFGATRYRAAAEPMLCILAAAAVVATLAWIDQRRRTTS